jgi:hypothetical protein
MNALPTWLGWLLGAVVVATMAAIGGWWIWRKLKKTYAYITAQGLRVYHTDFDEERAKRDPNIAPGPLSSKVQMGAYLDHKMKLMEAAGHFTVDYMTKRLKKVKLVWQTGIWTGTTYQFQYHGPDSGHIKDGKWYSGLHWRSGVCSVAWPGKLDGSATFHEITHNLIEHDTSKNCPDGDADHRTFPDIWKIADA